MDWSVLIVAFGIGFVSFFVWGGLIHYLYDFIFTRPKEKQYNETAMQQYNLALQSDQARIAGENVQKQIIQSRIDNIEYQKNQTRSALDKLYAVEIVYPKYHALVPIVMFCEYLESGRCEGLEGHEGAYNIYENELRQNIIIAKLDVVVNQLEQIKQNQYMLADAIERGNHQIEKLCNATMESAARLENIQKNQAINAENARIAANNTYVIGQLEAYRLMSGK